MRKVRGVDSRLRPPSNAICDCEGDGVIGRGTVMSDCAHEERILSAIWSSFSLRRRGWGIDSNAKGLLKLRVEVIGIFGGEEPSRFAG